MWLNGSAASHRMVAMSGTVVHGPVVPLQVSQLRHELSMKDELLQFYTSAAEESEGESSTTTP